MVEPDWKSADSAASVVQALAAHRLLPIAGLLAGRGLFRADLVPVAQQIAARSLDAERQRTAIEDGVLDALAAAGIRVLVLKGALLARTVYPAPETRLRTDIDLLVGADDVDDAGAALRAAGFIPGHEVHGGPPMTQAQWIRRGEQPVHAVDLHWDLSNQPLLKQRFSFEGLWERAVSLSGIGQPVMGLGAEDALLHACAHYFGHHRGEFRPDQWLLDMDLLWNSLDEDGRARVAEAALEAGIGSLLAAGMTRSRDRFETPVEEDWLVRLEGASRKESARRLVREPRFRALEIFRSASEERGLGASMRRLRGTFFPPAAYMRNKYPGAGRWALPWLYVRRVWEGRKI